MKRKTSIYRICWIVVLLVSVLGITGTLAAAPNLEQNQSVAAQTGLNLYAGPGSNYAVVGTVYSGQDISLLGRNSAGNWLKVQTSAGTQGWLSAAYIQATVSINSLPVVGEAAVSPAPASPAPAAPSTTPTGATAVIATGALNIRSGPGISYNILTTVYQGQTVTLLGRNSNSSWAKVRTSGGAEGWVNAYYIQPGVAISSLPLLEAGGSTPGSTTGTAVIATGALNVRTGPGLQYNAITVVFQGQVVTLLGRVQDNSWVKVRLSNGTEGWVNASLLQPSVAISSLPVVAAPPQPTVPTITVVTGALNVRTGPGVGYAQVTVLDWGDTATLIGRISDNSWVQIRLTDGREGWVRATLVTANVSLNTIPVITGWEVTATAVINSGALNVRTGPGLGYNAITVAYQGLVVTLLGRNADGSWVQVRLPNGTVGWVNASLVVPNIAISSLPVTG